MKKFKIAHLSDIHFSRIFPRKLFYTIYNNLKDIKPDYICITGDMIDQATVIEKETYQNELKYWLNKYSKIAPVIISLGNHDVSVYNGRNYEERYHKEWFKSLNNIKGVHFLDNEEYIPNADISFYGLTIPFKHYKEKEKNSLILPESDWRGEEYHVLLMHSPQQCLQETVLNQNKLLTTVDLILSGHMHRGLTPYFLNKIVPDNMGIVSPQKTFFTKYARGIIKKEMNEKTITLIISGGIVKLSETAPKLFHKLNRFFAPEITMIEIDGKRLVKASDIALK